MRRISPASYCRSGKDSVNGWLARTDAEMISCLLATQTARGYRGAVAEVGVHHGKSFILLALCNLPEPCYAIDIFGQQSLNIDGSGKGDKQIFLAHLARHGVPAKQIVIDERLSGDVSAQDIITRAGHTRFFHIDGGHHLEAISHDLRLAEATMTGHGIIAVDDVFRPEWPEVSMGTFAHLASPQSQLTIFAIGFNKTYLCRKEHAPAYRAALLSNDFLRMFLGKTYRVGREEIVVYQQYPLPEWRLRQRLLHHLKTYHPDLAYGLARLKRLLRR